MSNIADISPSGKNPSFRESACSDRDCNIGIALMVIAGIGGLVAAAVGLGLFLHSGSFGGLNELHSIIAITGTAIAGAASLIAAIVYHQFFGKESPAPLDLVFDSELNRWHPLPDSEYLRVVSDLAHAGLKKEGGSYETLVTLERLYSKRDDVFLFDCQGKIFKAAKPGVTPSFLLTIPITIPNYTPDALNTYIGYVYDLYIESLDNQERDGSLPKLIIPMGITAPDVIGHAVLLIIETDQDDRTLEYSTLINPFGNTSQYQKYEKPYVEMLNKRSTVCQNTVRQQKDGWSCTWHSCENIELLSKMKNAHQFVSAEKLPTYTSDQMQELYDKKYRK